MISARSGSSAFGIVAGVAIVSSGIMGGLLGGTAAEAATVRAAATNVCGQPPARTSAARSVPASQTAIVLDAVSLSSGQTPKPKATTSSTAKSSSSPSPSASASQSATAKATASASATAKATASASATAKASSTPKASSSATATPKATDSASATPSSSPSASSSPKASPSSSASATPSPTSTGSGSASPSPSPSPTGSSPSVQLCLEVQAITTKSGVHPGRTASYAIWVWPAGGAASGVTVTITGKVARKAVTPKFTVCPTASGRTCKVGGIAKGTSDELQATIAVPGDTAAGRQAVLTGTARSSDAAAPPAASAGIKITAKPKATHSPSPSPTPTPTDTGLGATLPAGTLPTVPLTTDPGASLGELPGPTTSAGSPGGLFPTVSPQPSASPSPYSAVLPSARGVRVTDAAAMFPFSTRLIGGELVGLAVLAAALALAIVRFSLRRPRPQHGKDAAS